jgi:hypothetical protein
LGTLIHAHRGRSRRGKLGFVLNSDRLGYCSLGLFLDGDSDLELGLCLGGAVELLVNRNVAGLQKDEGGSRIGVSLKHDFGVCGNVQESANLNVVLVIILKM